MDDIFKKFAEIKEQMDAKKAEEDELRLQELANQAQSTQGAYRNPVPSGQEWLYDRKEGFYNESMDPLKDSIENNPEIRYKKLLERFKK